MLGIRNEKDRQVLREVIAGTRAHYKANKAKAAAAAAPRGQPTNGTAAHATGVAIPPSLPTHTHSPSRSSPPLVEDVDSDVDEPQPQKLATHSPSSQPSPPLVEDVDSDTEDLQPQGKRLVPAEDLESDDKKLPAQGRPEPDEMPAEVQAPPPLRAEEVESVEEVPQEGQPKPLLLKEMPENVQLPPPPPDESRLREVDGRQLPKENVFMSRLERSGILSRKQSIDLYSNEGNEAFVKGMNSRDGNIKNASRTYENSIKTIKGPTAGYRTVRENSQTHGGKEKYRVHPQCKPGHKDYEDIEAQGHLGCGLMIKKRKHGELYFQLLTLEAIYPTVVHAVNTLLEKQETCTHEDVKSHLEEQRLYVRQDVLDKLLKPSDAELQLEQLRDAATARTPTVRSDAQEQGPLTVFGGGSGPSLQLATNCTNQPLVDLSRFAGPVQIVHGSVNNNCNIEGGVHHNHAACDDDVLQQILKNAQREHTRTQREDTQRILHTVEQNRVPPSAVNDDDSGHRGFWHTSSPSTVGDDALADGNVANFEAAVGTAPLNGGIESSTTEGEEEKSLEEGEEELLVLKTETGDVPLEEDGGDGDGVSGEPQGEVLLDQEGSQQVSDQIERKADDAPLKEDDANNLVPGEGHPIVYTDDDGTQVFNLGYNNDEGAVLYYYCLPANEEDDAANFLAKAPTTKDGPCRNCMNSRAPCWLHGLFHVV